MLVVLHVVAGADRHVEELAFASRLPDDQAGFPGRFAVDQDFGRAHGSGFGDIAEPDGDPLNRPSTIDQHRFAHVPREIIRGVLTRGPGDLRVRS